MSHKDLKQLEARLDKGLVKIRARKVHCDNNHIRCIARKINIYFVCPIHGHLITLQNEVLSSELEYMQRRVRENTTKIWTLLIFLTLSILQEFELFQEMELQNDNLYLRSRVSNNLLVIKKNVITPRSKTFNCNYWNAILSYLSRKKILTS